MILGSGALSGVNYPVDREWLAKELDFSKFRIILWMEFLIEILLLNS